MPDEERKAIFAKNFNEAMERKGIRQIDIVKDLGFNSSTVSNWSKGIMLPRSDKLKILSNYLGVSAAQLMGWSENYEFKDITSSSFDIAAIRRAIDNAIPSEQSKKEKELREIIDKLQSSSKAAEGFDILKQLTEQLPERAEQMISYGEDLLEAINKLNDAGQQKVKDYANDLAENPKYRK